MKENYGDIVKRLKGLGESIKELEGQRKTITDHMAFLENRGLICAAVHFRDEKYMYLIYPMTEGKRKRKYVGCDPRKIEDAKQGIWRASEYDRLKGQLEQIEGRMRNSSYYLDLADSAAS